MAMLYYMSSKIFQDIFLNNEPDDSILNAQYVIVSARIRKRSGTDAKNIIVANQLLYPNAYVYSELSEELARDRYYDQMELALPFFASLTKGALEEDYQIVFLCTKKEYKGMPYLDWMADFIYKKFKFPVYEYLSFVAGCKLIDYDEKKVLKKCNKILKETSKKQYMKNVQTPQGREIIKKQIMKMSKKELKKKVKKLGMYHETLSKEDMRELLILYM